MNFYTKYLFMFNIILFFIPMLFCTVLRNNHLNFFDNDDIYRNVSELISSKGYPVEVHTVQTKDGYLLTTQRIPHGRNNTGNIKRPVVYLQHGLLSSAADFVMNFPEQSLGFILADEGYDVWLGNTRGNTYSKNHIKLKPWMSAFWNYSFDQMAENDLPAMIDYILNTTGNENISYIGHSQGTTSAFALLSENPIYNKKIKIFIAMAPVTTVGYMTNAIKYFAPFATDLEVLSEILGINEFLPNGPVLKFLNKIVCETEGILICDDVVFFMFGGETNLNQTRLPVYFAHFPAGSSTKSIIHYAQMVNSKKFQKFDYGIYNKDYYHQDTPPEYDVSKITTPIALFWSLQDNLADKIDVNFLTEKLKSMIKNYCVPDPDFTHIDFAVAINEHARDMYGEIVTLLQHYKN